MGQGQRPLDLDNRKSAALSRTSGFARTRLAVDDRHPFSTPFSQSAFVAAMQHAIKIDPNLQVAAGPPWTSHFTRAPFYAR
jgi:hypothetical protein